MERGRGAWGMKGGAGGLRDKVQKQFGAPSIRAEIAPEAKGQETRPCQRLGELDMSKHHQEGAKKPTPG